MPITPATVEARAVALRLTKFSSCQGNAQYLHKLIYEDSAALAALIPELEAANPDETIVQKYYAAVAGVGSVGELGGNIQTWMLIEENAPSAILAAVDAIEAGAEEPPETPSTPEPR